MAFSDPCPMLFSLGAVERGEKNVSALSIAKIAKGLKIKPEKLLSENR